MKTKTASLRQGIILLCTGLVLITSIIIQAGSWWSTSQFNKKQISDSINNAQNVFEQYLQEKEKLLTTAARVLTADFGFKQAVTSKDAETISSVLLNHGQRIDADLMLLTDLQGQLISSSRGQFNLNMMQKESLSQVLEEQGEAHFVILQKTLYQILAQPVNAPRPVAYTLIGFEIDASVSNELKSLTGLDVSFFADEDKLLTSSMSFSESLAPQQQLMSATLPWFFWDRPTFDSRQLDLAATKNNPITVFLTADLSATYKEYDELISTITIIASFIMLAAILISGLFAKKLTKPLSHLVGVAKEFAQGQYSHIVADKKMSQEIATLFDAFSEMGKEIHAREQHILKQGQHDTLTHLYNRHTFRQLINKELNPEKNALLIAINIRGFSNLNDALGIQVGDQCLKALAKRLLDFDTETSTHARIDGDVFLSLIPLSNSDNVDDRVQDFLKLLAEPLQVNSLSLSLKFWVGITVFPQDSDDPEAIFRRSMIALDYAEKEKNPVRYYQQGEEEARLEHLKIVESLKHALVVDDGQLYMNYQPKLNLTSGKIDKVEALIRWQHPELGFVSPELFISYAEQTGIIFELTTWVVDTVLKQVAEWKKQGINIEAAINVSAQDLSHPEFQTNLKIASDKYNVSPEQITLEVTERDLMEDEEQAIALLVELKESGYSISVDDYGIGESSLAKLKQLPVDELKIDKSFIMKLDSSETDQIIVSSTITLGHRLGLSVVAEGLENNESLELLKAMQCDHIQGYFLARPMASDAFIEWLEQYYQNN